MYNGIGLQTPRGSGTNGYIQTNKFFVKPRSAPARVDYGGADGDGPKPDAPMRKPNKEILEHSRKRQIELRVLQLQENLEAQGYTEAEMAEKLQQARKDFEAESAAATAAEEAGIGKGRPPIPNKRFADSQSHRSAALKEKQLEIFREALDSGDQRRVRHDRREDSDKKRFIGNRSNEEERRLEFDQQKDDKNIIDLKQKGFGDKNSGKHAEERTDKHRSSTHQTEPDTSDWRDNKKNLNDIAKHGKHVNDEKSDYSDSDRDSGDSANKKLSKHARKYMRHDTDTDSDYAKNQKQGTRNNKKNVSAVSQKRKKSDKYKESDYSDSDSDSSHETTKEKFKLAKKHSRHDIDSDSEDARHKKREITTKKVDVTESDQFNDSMKRGNFEHAIKPKRYDSDSEGANYKKNDMKSNYKSKKSSKNKELQYSDSESYSSGSSRRERVKHAKKKKHAYYSTSDSDLDSDTEVAKNKKSKGIRNTKKSMANASVKQVKSIGSDESDYISSDTGSGDDNRGQRPKHIAKDGRHDSDSEGDRKKRRDMRGSQKSFDVSKTQGKSSKHYESDYSESDSGERASRKVVQHVNKESRYDTNLDVDAKHKKELVERQGAKSQKYNSEDSDLGTDDEKKRGLAKSSGSSKVHKNIGSINEIGKKDHITDMEYRKSKRHHSDTGSSDDNEDQRRKSHEKDFVNVKREHSSASRQGIYDSRKSKAKDDIVSELEHIKTRGTAEGERWKETESRSTRNDGDPRAQRREDYAKGVRDSRGMMPEDNHGSRKRAMDEQRYHDVRDNETRKRVDIEKDMSDRKERRYEDDNRSQKRSRINNSYEDSKRTYEDSPRHERHERFEHRKTEGSRNHDGSRDASRRHRDEDVSRSRR